MRVRALGSYCSENQSLLQALLAGTPESSVNEIRSHPQLAKPPSMTVQETSVYFVKTSYVGALIHVFVREITLQRSIKLQK